MRDLEANLQYEYMGKVMQAAKAKTAGRADRPPAYILRKNIWVPDECP